MAGHTCGPGRQRSADTGPDRVRGPYLRVSSNFARYFFVRVTLSGRRRDLGLAAIQVSLADARSQALDARRLKAHGIDPVDARHQKEESTTRDQAVASWTFQKCAEKVHETLLPGFELVLKNQPEAVNG